MIKKLIPSQIKRRIKLSLHSGDTYHCPICKFDAKDLYPLGFDIPVLKTKQVIGAGLRNAGCYKCFSSDRARLVFTYLRDVQKVFENKSLKILHMAPEKNISLALKEFGFATYVCGDLFTEGYEYPSYVQNMNVLNIPHEDNSFDLIICNHLLEHVPTDIEAMKELYRVLKVGGTAILQVPISKTSATTFEDLTITTAEERERVFGQYDHLRIYGQDYCDRLAVAGFSTERINISKDYPNYGLNPDEDIYLGRKLN